MKRAGGQHAADRRKQRAVRHRAHRPGTPGRCRGRRRQVPINARAGNAPHPAHRGQPVAATADRRDGLAHGARLSRAKGRLASRSAIFSCNRSRSISAAPSLAFSRSLSSSSPARRLAQRSLTGGQERFTPAAQGRRRHAQAARHRFEILAAQQPQHRRTLALSRHPAAAPQPRCTSLLRPRRLARPRFNLVHLIVHGPPLVRKSSACEVSQSTVLRGRWPPRLGRKGARQRQKFATGP